MELFGIVSTAVPFLLLKTPAAAYAQQEQQDLANLRQQEEPTEQENQHSLKARSLPKKMRPNRGETASQSPLPKKEQ